MSEQGEPGWATVRRDAAAAWRSVLDEVRQRPPRPLSTVKIGLVLASVVAGFYLAGTSLHLLFGVADDRAVAGPAVGAAATATQTRDPAMSQPGQPQAAPPPGATPLAAATTEPGRPEPRPSPSGPLRQRSATPTPEDSVNASPSASPSVPPSSPGPSSPAPSGPRKVPSTSGYSGETDK